MKFVIFFVLAVATGFLPSTGARAQVITVDSHTISGSASVQTQDDQYDWDPQNDGEYFDWPDFAEGTQSTSVTALASSNSGGAMGSGFLTITASLDMSGPLTLNLNSDATSNCSVSLPAQAICGAGFDQLFRFTLTEVQEYHLDVTILETNEESFTIKLIRLSDGVTILSTTTTQDLSGILSAGSYVLHISGGAGSSCNYGGDDIGPETTHFEYEFTLGASYAFTIKDGAGDTVNNRTLDLYAPSEIGRASCRERV